MHAKSIYVPIISPIDDNNQISNACVAAHLNTLRPYVAGVVCCLTSGEGWRLGYQHWCNMVKATLEHRNELDVVVGIELGSTDKVMEFADQAQSFGATAIILTTPFGSAVSQQCMKEHFIDVHSVFLGRIWIYHERSLSENDMTVDTLLEVSSLPRVYGIKDSTETEALWRIRDQFEKLGVTLYRGMESKLMIGGIDDSNLVSLANLEPELCHQATHAKYDAHLKAEIKRKINEYQLQKDDWYRYIKQTLSEKGIIKTDKLINEHEVKWSDKPEISFSA